MTSRPVSADRYRHRRRRHRRQHRLAAAIGNRHDIRTQYRSRQRPVRQRSFSMRIVPIRRCAAWAWGLVWRRRRRCPSLVALERRSRTSQISPRISSCRRVLTRRKSDELLRRYGASIIGGGGRHVLCNPENLTPCRCHLFRGRAEPNDISPGKVEVPVSR